MYDNLTRQVAEHGVHIDNLINWQKNQNSSLLRLEEKMDKLCNKLDDKEEAILKAYMNLRLHTQQEINVLRTQNKKNTIVILTSITIACILATITANCNIQF